MMCGKCFSQILFKINYQGIEMLHCICGWKTDPQMEFNRFLQAEGLLVEKIREGSRHYA